MDEERFDQLTRTLARSASRRTILKTMAGGFFGGTAAWPARERAAAFICRQPGALCSRDAHCCSGSCVNDHCTCSKGRTPCASGCCDPQPACTPKTCAGAGVGCGPLDDGCGKTLDCGTCQASDTCHAASCNAGQCVQSVGNEGAACDDTGGTCQSGQCVTLCTPTTTCASAGVTCGPLDDGCGKQLDCGTCQPSDTCHTASCESGHCVEAAGNDGAPCGDNGETCQNGICTSPCIPKTCDDDPGQCGTLSDGCDGNINCDCAECQTCGGGGQCQQADDGTPCRNGDGTCQSGSCACVPKTCADFPGLCGQLGDGCTSVITCQCGECQTCNGYLGQCQPADDNTACTNGTCQSGQCIKPCTPTRTCDSAGAVCGPLDDGCGHSLNCGDCAQPTDGCHVVNCVSGQCVKSALGDGTSCGDSGQGTHVCRGGECVCVPKTCNDYPGQCGTLSDGCSGNGTITCTCPECQTCFGDLACAPLATGVACTGGTCLNGECIPLNCDTGMHVCDGTCVSNDDTQTCGTSCTPCPQDYCHIALCDGTSCSQIKATADCCTSLSDCDDGNPCTADACDAGTCRHFPTSEGQSCGEGLTCQNGVCATCQPYTCDGTYAGYCGTFDDGCGGSLNCSCPGSNACETITCDMFSSGGYGVCNTATVTCGPCEYCDPAAGCESSCSGCQKCDGTQCVADPSQNSATCGGKYINGSFRLGHCVNGACNYY